ncbi:MAG TPA: FecR family protein [Polyangiaceae bacterium]|jgi:transmembrane sensor
MSDKLDQLRVARERMDPEWDAPKMERVLGQVHQRLGAHRTQRRVVTGLALAAGLCLAVGGGIKYGRHTAEIAHASTPASSVSAPPATENVLQYPDGSSAVSLAAGTRLQLDEASPDRVTTALERGAARFEVVPDHDREFRVKIDTVTITVLGTIFAVTRNDDSVHVAVQRGKVRVDSPRATAVLEVGQEGDYSFAAPSPAPAPSSSSSSARASSAANESWRALARRGRHRDAYALMHDLRPAQIGDAEELLAAADVARLSGHPREATPFLERVLTDFHADPRAPLAAFGLGRILLPSDPTSAAARFAEARALAPTGAIAEDALAREVEAWSRAGAKDKARAAAAEYARRYPQGSRADQVRAMGGL